MFIMSNGLLITKCIDYYTFYGIIWSERKDKREKKVIPLCNGRFFAPDTMCIFYLALKRICMEQRVRYLNFYLFADGVG